MMLSEAKALFDGWWLSKSASDRMIIGTAAAIVVAAVWFLLIWSPLQHARKTIQLQITEIDLARSDLARLRPDDTALLTPGAGLKDRLATTASERGLVLSGLETRDGRTVLDFETVAFDTLVGWLGSLEQNESVTVVAARLDRRPEPGTVSAEIELEER